MKKRVDPWGRIEWNPDTNLPALREGQWWEITPPGAGLIYYRINLCDDQGVLDWQPISEKGIEHSAAYMVYRGIPRRDVPPDYSYAVGKYPPKRLD